MATKELRELRHNYKAAYTDYMNCVHVLSSASLNGNRLKADEALAEEKAFSELVFARRVLLEELRERSGVSGRPG